MRADDTLTDVDMNPPVSITVMYRALRFAEHAHRERHPGGPQLRKYTGEPYIVHPVEVAEQVARWGGNAFMQAAALLHDVVEDTDVTMEEIVREFPGLVATWVEWLTDEYTKEAHPDLNRRARKGLEAERIGSAPWQVQVIKAADLKSNTSTIVRYDRGFAVLYLDEKEAILDQMMAMPQKVRASLAASLWAARRQLGQLDPT